MRLFGLEITRVGEKEKSLGEIQRLEIKPGDRFVMTCAANISDDVAVRLNDQWSNFVGRNDVKLLILHRGMTLRRQPVGTTTDAPLRS